MSDDPTTQSLAGWLARLEARAPANRIELGLERVRAVWRRLDATVTVPIITVGGTNGKGSVVAMAEAMLVAGGYRPFAYTSPHLLRFSERMRIAGEPAEDRAIVAALEDVEAVRGDVDLTYFEHVTLAALLLASRSQVDAMVLEVGLGGRLDAVNLLDADVAVVTAIDIDHAEFLGPTRSAIGREKAGIARRGRPAIVGDPDPPAGLLDALGERGAQIVRSGRELTWSPDRAGGMQLEYAGRRLHLPQPALTGTWQLANAASAVAALLALSDRLPLAPEAMADGLRRVSVPGRFQRLCSAPEVIVDVAHNPGAATALAAGLGPARNGSTAVFSALEGKDVAGIGRALDRCFTRWLIAPLEGPRGRSAEAISAELGGVPVSGERETVESLSSALGKALASSGPRDRVVVFGSFLTVAEALPLLASSPTD